MNRQTKYFVSTISDSPSDYFSNLEKFEAFGLNGIHFDVMDGAFVPRLGLFPELLKAISSRTSLPIEVHIMMDTPSRFIEVFVASGANRIIIHFESKEFSTQLISFAKKLNVEVGIAIKPSTPIEAIRSILPEVDSVLLMAINPGIPKHPILPQAVNRLRQLSQIRDAILPSLEIGVDGGVTFQNIPELVNNGADYLICGSGTVFDPGGSVESNIKKMFVTLP